MNVVIYARYSSHSQTEQSIEGQIAECKRFAKQNNFTIIGEYIDRALSATTDNRPQFLKMIEDSNKKSFNGVLVYQLDRFARNRYDSATYKAKLKKNNVRVFSARENISDDASGILMESVLEGMAEYYSAELSQKVKRGMEINANKCLSTGGTIPLGFKISSEKKYIIDNETSHIVKEIFEMYINGYTMADIGKHMNDMNYKTALGNTFTKNSIRGILSNKKYIGTYTYNGKEYPNSIPAIIDTETFNEAQIILSKNRKATAHKKAKTDYLLTTKLFCGHCKEMMVGVCGTSKTKKIHYYYSCNNHRKKMCNKINVKKDIIENLIIEKARQSLTDNMIDKIANSIVSLVEKEQNSSKLNDLYQSLKNNEKQKSNLIDSLKFCEFDSVKKTICEEIEKLDKQFISIQDEINFTKSQHFQITVPEVEFFLKSIRDGDVNDLYYKKHLINILINKVYLYDDYLIIIFNAKENGLEEKVPLIEDLESSLLDSNGSPTTFLFELKEQIDTNIILKRMVFFCCKNAIQERMVFKMKIIKQELEFEECLKQRLEFICEFSKVTPTFVNGSIRKLEKTNLTYIEPHRVIIKNITFLVFNYSNDVYISNLTQKIKLSELEEYLKNI